jgi:hypothetical protein
MLFRVLPVVLEIALLVYCLIDCIQSDSAAVRNLPKVAWILLIIFFPLVGGIAWLVAGRPSRRPRPAATRAIAPDDDPEFLRRLQHSNHEHEQMLKSWEEDLRRREEQLRKSEDDEIEGN